MNKLLALGLSVPLLACVVGSDGTTTGDDGTGPGTGTGPGPGPTPTAVHISSDMTLPAAYDVSQPTIIDAGAKVTIPAGATVKFAPGASIEVRGTLLVQGIKASPVHLSPSAAGAHYGSFSVPAGGVMTMSYGIQTGGGIEVTGGTITVADSLMSQSLGDFLVVTAGKATVSYSAIGLEPGAGTDTIHCNMHFDGIGTTLSVTHSTISGNPYGVMLYGGTGVDLTSNNWISNGNQVDTRAGIVGDVSGGFFDRSPPTPVSGATLTRNNLAATRLPAATADPIGGTGPR
jgi:hypothetical protein